MGGLKRSFERLHRKQRLFCTDWDILILVDKSRLEPSDYDDIAYPLVEFGWTINECISPVMYTLKDWLKYSFTPFFHNVKKEGIEL